MVKELQTEAEALIKRAADVHLTGKPGTPASYEQLEKDLQITLPSWYKELFTGYPLCGLEIGWKDEDDEVWFLEIADTDRVKHEGLRKNPGSSILKNGYICLGADSSDMEEPYYISIYEGEDPPVYQIFRDLSDDPAEILDIARVRAADTLSSFFRNAFFIYDGEV